MQTLWLRVVQLFLISLPQNISIIIGLYAFNKRKINIREFLECTVISLAAIFLIRFLPISLGINTLLGMIVLIFLGVNVLKFPVYSAIKSVLFTTIIILLIELINMNVLTYIYGTEGFKALMDDPLKNSLAGFLASVMLFLVIIILYFIFTRRIKKEEESV